MPAAYGYTGQSENTWGSIEIQTNVGSLCVPRPRLLRTDMARHSESN